MTNYCEARGCGIPEEHLTTCNKSTCTGCWPREATHGFLCQNHYEQVDTAISTADRLRKELQGIERAIRTESISAVAGPRVPLTAIRLDLEAIDRWQNDVYNERHQLVTRGYDGNLDRWISNPDGARRAAEFAREVRAADRAHPTQERPHKLRRTRCPECRQLSFVWYPPDEVASPVRVECHNPACEKSVTRQTSIDTMAHIEASAPSEEQQTMAFIAALRRQKKQPDSAPGSAA